MLNIASGFSKAKELFSVDRQDLFIAFLAIASFIALTPILTYIYFAQDLTTKERIMNRNNTGVVLTDRADRTFFTFYEAKQATLVSINQIPGVVTDSVIAVEDRDFYSHPGFSIKSIARALVNDIKAGDTTYGASTITQQLVKNSLLTPQKNFLRKFQELVLSQEIERRFSKDEILEMYLNSAYFGEGAFGIEAAANRYFNKSAQDLTLAQASILAGLLPSPSKLSPISGDLEESKQRQQYVLTKMLEQGLITPEERLQAQDTKLVFEAKDSDINSLAPHFALFVKQQLIEKYGEEVVSRSGLKVKTTLDLDWQAFAEKQVSQQIAKLASNRVSNGAAVALDPKTGEIKVMVGSKNWYDNSFGKVNIASSLRPPGSAFKPIVYAAALERKEITPATVLHDQPTTFKGNYVQSSNGYQPKNYDGRFRGLVSPRRALANSLNVPAVEVMSKVGVPNALEMANRLGVTSLDDPSNYGLSLVLGAGEVKLLELAQTYATFANQGVKNEPTAILEITDKYGRVIYQAQPEPQPVLSPEVAFIISSILSDNQARREVFGNNLTIKFPAAVKTGTTEDYKDALTVGYTPSLVVAVWVGNNDNAPMDQVAGSLGAAPIWKALMEKFLEGQPVEKFTIPSGIVELPACAIKDASASANGKEYFIKGSEPQKKCNPGQLLPSLSLSPSNQESQPSSAQPSPDQQPSPGVQGTTTQEIGIEINQPNQENIELKNGDKEENKKD